MMDNKFKQSPLVSIVIPTYNRENLILRAINSVDEQTFQNFEIIVVDDASTDSTEQVIADLNHSKIKYVKLEENVGQCAARNVAINMAEGEYIGLLDSDDIWLPEKLEKQIEIFKNSDDKLGAVYCGNYEIDEVKNTKTLIDLPKYRGDIYRILLGGFCPSTTSKFLLKKKALLDVGSFDEYLPTFVDFDLWLRIAQKGYTFDYVDEPMMIKYEHHGEQMAKHLYKRLEGLKIFSEKWGKEMKKVAGARKYRNFKKNKVLVVVRSLLDSLPKRYRKEVMRSLFLLIRYRITDIRSYVKIFIVLVFGKNLFFSIKDKF